MIKTIIIHHLLDMNDLPAAERWFYRYHIPEVLRNQPVSYVSFRAVPPPPGAEAFGYYNYKVHENLNRGEGEKPLGLLTMTQGSGAAQGDHGQRAGDAHRGLHGPGHLLRGEDHPALGRSPSATPKGVSVEEGDDWYVNVHAKEVMQQPGLTRFFSYQGHRAAGGHGQGGAGVHASAVGGLVRLAPHQRAVVREQQRLGGFGPHQPAGLHQAAVGDPRRATPSWSPGSNFASTFILERPSDDWLREVPRFYV